MNNEVLMYLAAGEGAAVTFYTKAAMSDPKLNEPAKNAFFTE